MTPQPSNRAYSILDAALKQNASEIESFISDCCGEDEALHAEVRALLAQHAAPAGEEGGESLDFTGTFGSLLRLSADGETETEFAGTLGPMHKASKPRVLEDSLNFTFGPLLQLSSEQDFGEGGDAMATMGPISRALPGQGQGTASDEPDVVIMEQPPGSQANESLPVANPAAPVPFVFGRRIAKGGMGAVLEADDCKLDRKIAVKVMLPGQDISEIHRQRFVQEAAVLGRLEHPNIVPIHDLGFDSEGQLYYTMKLVKGCTLQAIINDLRRGHPETRQEFTLERLLTIFRKICDALAFAHSKGIIHRDLKPENIMVGEFGEVLVMDWGIAKWLGDKAGTMKDDTVASEALAASSEISSPTATLQGSVMGTPKFMSPEQAMGRIAELDERSDIFSLGGILYAMLTLRPPVEGKSVAELLAKVSCGNISPPTEFGSTSTKGKPAVSEEVLEAKKLTPLPHIPAGRVPPALSAVAMKALALDKSKRYQTVTEFGADIEAYQNGFATSAERAGLGKQLILLIKRNKGMFTTAAAAWLLITALAIWFVINLRTSEKAAREAESVAVEEKESARQALAQSALALAEAASREGNGPAMQAALGEVPDDLRDSTWNYLLAQSDSSIAQIRTSTNEIDAVAADPHRAGVFAVSDWNQKITVLNVHTGEHLLEFQPGFEEKGENSRYRLAFSSDGLQIAIGRDGPGGIVIHSSVDGAKLREWAAPRTASLDYSGNKLLQESTDGLHMWDAAAGTLLWQDRASGTVGVKGEFIPGSGEVVKFKKTTRLQVVSAADGGLIRELGGRGTVYNWKMVVRPDGKALFTHTESRVTECVSLEDGKILYSLPRTVAPNYSMGVTRDGAQFVSVVRLVDGVHSIQAWNAKTGDLLRSVLGGRGEVRGLSLHPLSNELLVTGPAARAFDLSGAQPRWRFPATKNPSVAFWGSDDLVLGAVDTSVRWGLQRLLPSGMETVWLPTWQGVGRAAVSADGSVAAMSHPTSGPGTVLLRSPGPSVEQFGSLKSNFPSLRLRFSPKGERLAVMRLANTPDLRIFDTARGKIAIKLDLADVRRINDLAWLGSERVLGLVTLVADRGNPGAQEKLVLWDAASGKILTSVESSNTMDALAVSPDGSSFAEAGADKRVRIHDTATLDVRKEFRAHDGPITALAWHPSKPILATTSLDLSIRLWNLETGRRLEEFHEALAEPTQLVFSPSGRRLGFAAEDGIARIWEPPTLSDSPDAAKSDGWEDILALLKSADLKGTSHGWRLDNGVLSSPDRPTMLPLPGNLSGTSYAVRLKLRQLTAKKFTAKNVFQISLPVGDNMAGFELDGGGRDGYYTGLTRSNGKGTKGPAGSLIGKQVLDSEQHDLELTVRSEGTEATISTLLDGRPLYSWTGSINTLSQGRGWVTEPGVLSLGARAADWVVSELKVKRLGK